MEDSIAKPLNIFADNLTEVLVTGIIRAVSPQLGAAIAALTRSSFAGLTPSAGGKYSFHLSPALSSPDVIVFKQPALVEEVARNA